MTPAELRSLIDADPTLAEPLEAGRTGEVAAALNAKTGTLPAPAPMYFVDLIAMVQGGAISQASFVKVWQHPRFPQFYADVLSGNHYAVANLYPAAFATDGTLNQAEAAALATYASRTAPMPASPVEIAANTPGELVTITQVDEARYL